MYARLAAAITSLPNQDDTYVPGCWLATNAILCVRLLADSPVSFVPLALLVRFALEVDVWLQWCVLPTLLPHLLPQLCSSVCASPAMVVLQTLHWDVPPAPSVRPVQLAATAQVAQQMHVSLVVLARLPLPLDPQVLLPVCARLGESVDTASSVSRRCPLMKHALLHIA
jgi:hypothetical protein